MKKKIADDHELIAWCESILLDEDFKKLSCCPKVSFWFSSLSFEIQGELTVNYFNLDSLPQVIKQADSLEFFARSNMLMFRAQYNSD